MVKTRDEIVEEVDKMKADIKSHELQIIRLRGILAKIKIPVGGGGEVGDVAGQIALLDVQVMNILASVAASVIVVSNLEARVDVTEAETAALQISVSNLELGAVAVEAAVSSLTAWRATIAIKTRVSPYIIKAVTTDPIPQTDAVSELVWEYVTSTRIYLMYSYASNVIAGSTVGTGLYFIPMPNALVLNMTGVTVSTAVTPALNTTILGRGSITVGAVTFPIGVFALDNAKLGFSYTAGSARVAVRNNGNSFASAFWHLIIEAVLDIV
jgi:hypothetical protein